MLRLRAISIISLMVGALGIGACGGISDCKDDGAACAALLNDNAQKCAEAYQLRPTDKKRKYCEAALSVVREKKVAAAAPGLITILKSPESKGPSDRHRQDAAKALGDIGAKEAVSALVEVLKADAGTSGDQIDKNTNRSNEAVADALGKLGDKAATSALLNMVKNARDRHAVLKSIRALGSIRDPGAVDALVEVALKHDEKFIRKNAVIALGDIGDPKATDALIQMMFIEFAGVSFYREASFALFQVGPPAAEALIKTMNGENKDVNTYFEKNGGLRTEAVVAKTGQVLADLRDKRAAVPLIEAFKKGVKSQNPVIMGHVPPALGMIQDAAAVPELSKQMLNPDASMRNYIQRALNQIGDRSVAKDIIESMSKAHFVEACVKWKFGTKQLCEAENNKPALYAAQKVSAEQGANLATAEHLNLYKAQVAGEQDEKMKAYFKARLPRVEAAAECKLDAACWAGKLKSSDAHVRTKAAYELGRLKDSSTVGALAAALADKDREARYAAIFAYFNYGDKSAVAGIEKTLADEKGSADFIRVNEDLKRLLIHLKRS